MSNDTLLIFDLADRPGRIGILEGGDSIIWHPLAEGVGSRKVVETVHAFLRQRKLKLSQVSAFLSVVGGSSLTGMRLGASVANAFAWALGRAAIAVTPGASSDQIRAAYESAEPNALIEITYPSHPILKTNSR